MYERHYGFTEKPFNLTPDPKYLYLSQRHTEAFAHLEFGRKEKGGFILITGEVGTGKTTLARYFLSRLDSRTATAVVFYPAVTAVELLRSILEDLHVTATGTSLKDHVDALHRFLLEARVAEREVVLLLDEAQDLSPEVLEQIRLISNLETDTEKLIQIVLMGQSELQEMLARRELRQLAQRVTARYHLSPLSRQETEDYIRHRLMVAGGEGKVSFTAAALAAVHQKSGGIPRLVNLICDRALLGGYVAGTRVIDAPLVRQAARETSGPPKHPRHRMQILLATAVVLAAVASATAWRGRLASAETPARAAALAPAVSLPAANAPPVARPSSLAPVVATLPRSASYDAALGEVRALWGGDALERTVLRTHMDQVRRLDLPAVLEMFHPGRTDTCYLALLRIEGDHAVVSTGSGAPLRVPLAEVDRLWTRQAVFLWKDFDALSGAADPARTAAWARHNLSRMGYLGGDPDLAGAVARFQRDAELAADGVIGARTLMTLYSRAAYPRPRLQGGTS
jgi:general secretion pathway protein A